MIQDFALIGFSNFFNCSGFTRSILAISSFSKIFFSSIDFFDWNSFLSINLLSADILFLPGYYAMTGGMFFSWIMPIFFLSIVLHNLYVSGFCIMQCQDTGTYIHSGLFWIIWKMLPGMAQCSYQNYIPTVWFRYIQVKKIITLKIPAF